MGVARRSERAIFRGNLQRNIFETLSFATVINSNRRVGGNLRFPNAYFG
jgi:hypothetical protein